MATEVRGAKQLRKVLREFEPDLAKEVQKEVAGYLKPITKKAKGFIPSASPLSNWPKSVRFPKYDAVIMRRGITYKTTPTRKNRRGFSYAASIHNKTAPGAIFETAGRRPTSTKKSARPNFAQALGQMQGQDKLRGRAMYAAWAEDKGNAAGAVLRAIQKSANKFKARRGI